MKKLCISLLLLVTGVYAAESSSSSSAMDVRWDAKALHESDGVHIVLGVRGGMDEDLQAQFVQMFSHSLALKLNQDLSFQQASSQVQSVLQACETKVKETKVDAFFEGMKRSLAGKPIESPNETSIKKMLLTVSLAKSGVKLKVEGSTKSKEYQMFFPPYTIVSEGNTELSPEEKKIASLQEEMAKAQKKFDEFNSAPFQMFLGDLSCSLPE